MTIPFGRRRLILSVALTRTSAAAPARSTDPFWLLGADDHELARLSLQPGLVAELARLEGFSIFYGGQRRP